jgi:hypothetical protein
MVYPPNALQYHNKGERVFQPVDHGLESPCPCGFIIDRGTDILSTQYDRECCCSRQAYAEALDGGPRGRQGDRHGMPS